MQEFNGWYLRGDIGLATNNSSNLNLYNTPEPLNSGFFAAGANESFNNTTISSSELADFGVGYRVNNWFRGDVTFEYRDGGHFQSLYTLNNPNAGEYGISQLLDFYRANISSAIGLVNAYADLGTWYGVTPFVGGGVGVAGNWLYGMTDQGQVSIAGGGTGPSGGYFSNAREDQFCLGADGGPRLQHNAKPEAGARLSLSGHGQNRLRGLELRQRHRRRKRISASPIAAAATTSFLPNRLVSNDFRVGLLWTFGETYAPPPPEAPLVRKY